MGTKRAPGRPSVYTHKKASAICTRIADGESLRSICASRQMPTRSTVFKWLAERREFSDQYAHAREAQADLLAEEIIEIADDACHDTVPKVDKEGNEYGEQANSEWIARSRLRVDARKWMASKLAPKKYGDRVTHAGDPTAPVALILNGSDVHG